MDNYLFYAAILLVFLTLYDILITVLSHNGAGPITNLWTSLCWKFVLFTKYKLNTKFIIRYAGPVLLFNVLTVWYILLYFAWFIFLYTGDYTIKNNADSIVRPLDIIYFIGSTFSTLGMGDYTPNGFPWTIITTLGSLLVSLLISFAISYFIPVVGAVADRRELSSSLKNIGRSSDDILKYAWTGETSGKMDDIISSIPKGLIKESYKSQVYPIVDYFYYKETGSSINLNILSLYDALIFQKIHNTRSDNISWNLRDYLLKSINTYIENFLKNNSYRSHNFQFDHSDFIKFVNSYSKSSKKFLLKDLDDEVAQTRESLLVFAYYEGRLNPVNNKLKQKYVS